jgi:glutamyl/glutaminyl-tRNA synthetase
MSYHITYPNINYDIFQGNRSFYYGTDALELISRTDKVMVDELIESFYKLYDYSVDSVKMIVTLISQKLQCKLKDVTVILRVILTGQKIGPSLYDLITVLGRDRVVLRLINVTDFCKIPNCCNSSNDAFEA